MSSLHPEAEEQLGAGAYLQAFGRALIPPPTITVSEWAEQNRWISGKYAAQPGKWRNDRTPYLVEIMDALSPAHPCAEVSFMKGSQIGGTEGPVCNWVGYTMDQAPVPMLVVCSDLQMARRFSKQRLDPMIADCEALQLKVHEKKSRDSGNTMLLKEFAGGMLVLAGANSGAGLRSTPICNAALDEIDTYPQDADGEGDPVWLAQRGQRNFTKSKTLKVSTPTIEGQSRIKDEYERGDQSRYLVPCPHCGSYQELVWGDGKTHGIKWEGDDPDKAPETACYVCAECHEDIAEHHKTRMLEAGRWEARLPERSRYHRSFFLSALYSPLGWFSWGAAVRQFIEAKGDPDKLRVFTNQTLGLPWKNRGDVPDWEALFRRRERFRPGRPPKGVVVLTAGVDVQRDRLEVLVRGWAPNLENWAVDFRVLPGDPDAREVWKKLGQILDAEWARRDGVTLRILGMAIDCAFNPTPVYAFARRHGPERVFPVRGRDDYPMVVGQRRTVDFNRRGRRVARGAFFWPVGVGTVKTELYGWLRQEAPLHPEEGLPRGWEHFPRFDEEWFKQLCSEQLVRKTIRGRVRSIWEAVRERNEVLDCHVYSRVPVAILGIDRWKAPEWATAAGELAPGDTEEPEQEAEGGSWLGRWRDGH